MSESGPLRPHSVPLLDTGNYPRQFSVSLLCSVLLHAIAATVLFQEVRFPPLDTVRDVFLTSDWEEPVVPPTPRPAGGGARSAPLQSSPAPRRAVKPAPIAATSPAPATPKPDSESRLAKSADPAERRPAATPAPVRAPVAPPAPAPAPAVASAPTRAASQSTTTSALDPVGIAPPAPDLPPAAPVVAPYVAETPAPPAPTPPAAAPAAPPAPTPVAPPVPPARAVAAAPVAAPVAPEMPPASALAPPVRIEEPQQPPPPPPAPAAMPFAPPPAVAAPERGPSQAPAPVARQTAPVEQRPLAPPSEVQPLIAAPALPPAPAVDAPVAPAAPSLGLPAPPAPPPTLASTVPPAPIAAPLDWEVPAAPERDRSSVGRSNEGATQPVAPAAPAPSVASAPAPTLPKARPAPGPVELPTRGASERATAPEAGVVPPTSSGLGTASMFASGALSAQRAAERTVRTAIASGQGTAEPKPTATVPGTGASTGTAVSSATAVRTGPAAGGVPAGVGMSPDKAERVGSGAATGVATGTPSGAAIAGTEPAPAAAGTPSGGLVAGAPAGPLAAGTSSGTDVRSAGPGGAGDAAEGRPASGPVTSESGTGSGGQAIAQGGAGRANQDGVGKGLTGGVAITTPLNGHTLSPDEPPIVIVRGNVENVDVDAVSLLVNKRRIEVPVRDGKFQYPVVVVDPITKISAEIPKSDARRSESITVHAAPNATTTAVILLDWGETKPTGGVEMSGLWRARSDRAEETQMKLSVRTATLPDDIPFTAFYLRNMQAGVYTFLLGYKGIGGGTPVVPKFFLTSPGTPTAREMKTMSLAGTGRTVSVRVLLPQAVLWEQDEWFTGRSEASDTITKFRDDGTTWIERKGVPVGR